jgi:hypothetical protein
MGVTQPGSSGDCWWRTRAWSGRELRPRRCTSRGSLPRSRFAALIPGCLLGTARAVFWLVPPPAQLWRRVCAETTAELQLLLQKWQLLLAGLVFQVRDRSRLLCCSCLLSHEMLFSAPVPSSHIRWLADGHSSIHEYVIDTPLPSGNTM